MKSIRIDFNSNINLQLEELQRVDLDVYFIEVLRFIHEILLEDFNIECLTSGSTGNPKKFYFNKKQALASARISNNFFNLNSKSLIYLTIPVRYIAAKMLIIRALLAKSTIVVYLPSSNVFNDISIENLEEIDFISLTPFQLNRILDETPNVFLRIKNCLLGGAEISNSIVLKIASFTECTFFESFGMTETLSHFAIKNLSQNQKVFSLLPEFEMNINVDNSLNVFHPLIIGKWIETNDIVEQVSSSQFIWKGRKDNIINSGGVKIQIEELEKVLKIYINENIAISFVPDNELGQKVVLVLDFKLNESELNELKYALKNLDIPKFWQPKIVLSMNIPKTENGKIKRKELSEKLKNFF